MYGSSHPLCGHSPSRSAPSSPPPMHGDGARGRRRPARCAGPPLPLRRSRRTPSEGGTFPRRSSRGQACWEGGGPSQLVATARLPPSRLEAPAEETPFSDLPRPSLGGGGPFYRRPCMGPASAGALQLRSLGPGARGGVRPAPSLPRPCCWPVAAAAAFLGPVAAHRRRFVFRQLWRDAPLPHLCRQRHDAPPLVPPRGRGRGPRRTGPGPCPPRRSPLSSSGCHPFYRSRCRRLRRCRCRRDRGRPAPPIS